MIWPTQAFNLSFTSGESTAALPNNDFDKRARRFASMELNLARFPFRFIADSCDGENTNKRSTWSNQHNEINNAKK